MSKSTSVVIQTEVIDEGYERSIVVSAEFLAGDEMAKANVVKSFDLYKAEHLKGVTVENATEALKREALRELVTQLNLHGVL